MTYNDIAIASLLAKNNAGEQEAIEGYFQLLGIQGLPQELFDDIKEIISDESNHSHKLSLWVERLTGIKPANS